MRPIKYAEKGLTLIAGGLFNSIQSVNKYQAQSFFYSKMVRQTPFEILAEEQANPRLATNHRFPLS